MSTYFRICRTHDIAQLFFNSLKHHPDLYLPLADDRPDLHLHLGHLSETVPNAITRRLLDLDHHIPFEAFQHDSEDEIDDIGLETGRDSCGGRDGKTDFRVGLEGTGAVLHVYFEGSGPFGIEIFEHGLGEAISRHQSAIA